MKCFSLKVLQLAAVGFFVCRIASDGSGVCHYRLVGSQPDNK